MKTIPLTQGKVAFIDDADFEAVSQFKWYANKVGRRFYARRDFVKPDGEWTHQYLHHFLLPEVGRIDHRDGNSLNDQHHNLRPSTHQQNLQGFQMKKVGATSKFRGVCWNKLARKWEAQIEVDGKKIHLGLFESEIDAAKAYDKAARKHFKEFASPNFPSHED